MENVNHENRLPMLEPRMVYEHLMCDAFGCGRFDYHFVKADSYDGINNHVAKTLAYIESALIVLSMKKVSMKEKIQKYISMVELEKPSEELADRIMIGIHEDNIVC